MNKVTAAATAVLCCMSLGGCPSMFNAGSEENPTGVTHLAIAQFGDLQGLQVHDGKDRSVFGIDFDQTVERACRPPARPELCTVTHTKLNANTGDSNGSTAAGQALVAQTDVLKTQSETAGKAVDLLGGLVGTAVKVAPK